jgi:integrase
MPRTKRKRKSKRLAFTKTALERLLMDHDGERLVVHDTKQPGLIAELRPGGTLSFYLYRWSNGRPCRLRIGSYPAVGIDAARDQCRKWIGKQVDGVDLSVLRRQKRDEATLKDLFEHWLEQHAKPHKRTWHEDERQYRKFLSHWASRRLSAIRTNDVLALHTRVGREHGHYAANRLLSLLAAMFAQAKHVGFAGANPAVGIAKFRESKRDRILQPAELPTFFAAVDAETDETLRDFFRMLVYTGARKGNVQSMAWSDVDLNGAIWRIPMTKSGEPVRTVLPAPAVEILRRRQSHANGCPWVFPSGRKHGETYLQDPKAAWLRLLARGGFKDLRMHDLRRTFGSFQAAAGASMAVIGKSLGHKPGSRATAVYAHLDLDPVRASVDVAVAAIVAASKQGGDNGKA